MVLNKSRPVVASAAERGLAIILGEGMKDEVNDAELNALIWLDRLKNAPIYLTSCFYSYFFTGRRAVRKSQKSFLLMAEKKCVHRRNMLAA
jgi:hypothetical protein